MKETHRFSSGSVPSHGRTRRLAIAIAVVACVAVTHGTVAYAAPETDEGSVDPDPQAEPIPGAARTSRKSGPGRVRASVDDGFGLDSADGRFGFSLGILGQLRYAVDAPRDEDVDAGFSLRLARLMVQGHLWGERVTWQLQTETAGGIRMLDANATINIHPAFSVLAGQYRPWFTRGFPTNLPVQALPDRGTVLDAFRVNRDVGVTVMGQPFDGRMEYYVGVLNGEGASPGSSLRNPQPLLTARLVGAPLGRVGYNQTRAANADGNLPWRFAFAANAATNEISREGTTTDIDTGETTTVPLPDLRTVVVGGDVAVEGWRLTAMGEGFWRRNWASGPESTDAWGAYGLLTGVVIRHRLDLSARVGVLRREVDSAAHLPIEPGLSVYVFGDHAKLQFRYRCDLDPNADECITHGGDVQAQLWF